MAESYNIVIEQNATFQLSISYEDSDGNPVDLTGYTAAMQVRSAHDSDSAVVDVDSAAGGSGDTEGIDLDASGNITVVIAKATTAALDPGEYVYDVLLTAGNGAATRLIEGSATVTPGVTA